jgi:hypothetical protein
VRLFSYKCTTTIDLLSLINLFLPLRYYLDCTFLQYSVYYYHQAERDDALTLANEMLIRPLKLDHETAVQKLMSKNSSWPCRLKLDCYQSYWLLLGNLIPTRCTSSLFYAMDPESIFRRVWHISD